MQLSQVSRFAPKWVLILAAILIVVGNVCEFSNVAHGSTQAPVHENGQSGDQHHHGAAHLTSCEGAAVPASSAPALGLDAAPLMPRLEAFLKPRHVRAVTLERLPVSLSGPPLYVLHAALLI